MKNMPNSPARAIDLAVIAVEIFDAAKRGDVAQLIALELKREAMQKALQKPVVHPPVRLLLDGHGCLDTDQRALDKHSDDCDSYWEGYDFGANE